MLAPLLLVLTANPALDEARALYDQFKFKEAVRKLDWASSRLKPEDRVDFELLSGLCRFNLNQVDAAKAHFRAALELDATVELPRDTTPKARDLFAGLKAERLKAMPPPAAAPTPTPTPTPSPSPSPEPQRSEPAPTPAPIEAVAPPPPSRSYAPPITIGALAVVSGAVGGVFGYLSKQAENSTKDAFFESDAYRFAAQARSNALVANVLFAVAGAAALTAVLWLIFG